MSHIYVGNPKMVDPEVLERVKLLGNEFWVFAEFDIQCNVDFLVIRLDKNGGPASLILTELKRSANPLQGSINGAWKRRDKSGKWVHINAHNDNYYQQAVRAANTLKSYLWQNRMNYLGDAASHNDENLFGVWPTLLILSPIGVRHEVPERPMNNFGRWWFNLEEWTLHLFTHPPFNVPLTEEDVRRLAARLNLEHAWSGDDPATRLDVSQLRSLAELFFSLRQLDGRLAAIEQRPAANDQQVKLLEPRLTALEQKLNPPAPPFEPLLEKVGRGPTDPDQAIDYTRAVLRAIDADPAWGPQLQTSGITIMVMGQVLSRALPEFKSLLSRLGFSKTVELLRFCCTQTDYCAAKAADSNDSILARRDALPAGYQPLADLERPSPHRPARYRDLLGQGTPVLTIPTGTVVRDVAEALLQVMPAPGGAGWTSVMLWQDVLVQVTRRLADKVSEASVKSTLETFRAANLLDSPQPVGTATSIRTAKLLSYRTNVDSFVVGLRFAARKKLEGSLDKVDEKVLLELLP